MNRLPKLARSLLFLAILAALLIPVSAVLAQSGQPLPSDDEVNAIAKQLYCPVCENIPLDVCGTQACAQWRELIREKLAEGWSEQQIKDYFVLQYGDRVLATPPARGLNWLVYIVPPIAFILGVVILVRAYQMLRAPARPKPEPSTAQPSAPAATDEYIARLEQELKKKA